MELRQLRYFAVLAEELNFTRAAERLNISQPPLSVQISQLEDELQVRLFNRTSRKVELTEAGRAFQRNIANVFGHLHDAVIRTQEVEQGMAGHIDMGLSGSHFLSPLPELIHRHTKQSPDIAIALHEMQPAQQLEALQRGHLDVSISRTEINDSKLFSTLLWEDPVVAALPSGHALSDRQSLTLNDLRAEAFVMLKPETSSFAQRLYSACLMTGFAPNVAQHISEIPAQLSLVSAGLGVALVPESTCRQSGGFVVCKLEGTIPAGDVYAVRQREPQSAAVERFLQYVKNAVS